MSRLKFHLIQQHSILSSHFYDPFFRIFFLDEKLLKITKGKTKDAAWVVSNCYARSGRTSLMYALRKGISVDVFGGCGNYSCDRTTWDCFNFEPTYRFYLAFENSLCIDYVTEKVYKIMYQNIIPIVYNGADMTRFLPPKSVSFTFIISDKV